jgi:hypothetical protein
LSSADESWVVVAVLFTACSIAASAEESPPQLTVDLSLFLASALEHRHLLVLQDYRQVLLLTQAVRLELHTTATTG